MPIQIDLPDHIWLSILELLPVDSRYSFQYVCRRFSRIICHYKLLSETYAKQHKESFQIGHKLRFSCPHRHKITKLHDKLLPLSKRVCGKCDRKDYITLHVLHDRWRYRILFTHLYRFPMYTYITPYQKIYKEIVLLRDVRRLSKICKKINKDARSAIKDTT